jgi:hypothetical protein
MRPPFPQVLSIFPGSLDTGPHPPLVLQTFCYDDRRTVLPALTEALGNCGCWVLERNAPSATQVALRFELQLRSALDLYSALMGSGLELTRAGHLGLTGLCTVRKHRRRHPSPFRVVEVRLEIKFLEEILLAGALLSDAGAA